MQPRIPVSSPTTATIRVNGAEFSSQNVGPTVQGVIQAAMLLIGLMLAGCAFGTAPEPAYTRVTGASLQAGNPIPLPTEEVVLTVRGQIGTANQGDRIVMDIPTIEAVGLVDYTVLDPFKNVEITYRGVLMADLLDVWQVPDSATTLDVLALNDYRAEVPISLLREFPVLFAIQADETYMPVEDRGPAMLVFPYNEYEFERPLTDAYWVWQISAITVD